MNKPTKAANYCYDHLPWELVIEILSWLPAESLVRFKRVSKPWHNLINDPKFIKLHLDRSHERNSNTFLIETRHQQQPKRSIYCFRAEIMQPHPSYHVTEFSYPNDIIKFVPSSERQIHGSCNGLVCISDIDDDSPSKSLGIANLCLYNPATRAIKRLPPLSSVHTRAVAFGYDCVSDDYKVFAGGMLWKKPFKDIYSLYSLRSDAWEIIANNNEDVPWVWKLYTLDYIAGNIFVDNTFHWMATRDIKCFELSTQRYYEIPFPEEINYGEYEHNYKPHKLTVLRGQLCMVTHNLDIWILKGPSNNARSWTRIFRNLSDQLDRAEFSHLWTRSRQVLNISCIKDGRDIIIIIRHASKLQRFLICCDLESKEARKIEIIPSLPEDMKHFEAEYMIPWVDSLVPLD